MRGTRRKFNRIPGNLLRILRNVIVLTFRGMFQKISGECLRRFRGMFEEIPGNVEEDPGECSRGFWGMFKRIPGNAQEDFEESKFRFILWNLVYFLSNSAIKLRKKQRNIFCATNYYL